MKMLRKYHHPDHASTELSTSLCSSSWITDNTGRPIQHLHYLPYGEDWVDQRNSSWNSPYTFSGKEKDVETGYGYFGARYYDSGLSIWLSVDPMSDKYPNMSPYNYCANNPVILVDPDGRDVYIIGEQAIAAFDRMLLGTNLSIIRHDDGRLVVTGGESLNDNDRQLAEAINTSGFTAIINADNNSECNDEGGSYMGSKYNNGSPVSTNNVHIDKLIQTEGGINSSIAGSGMIHEITEGFEAAQICQTKGSDIAEARFSWKQSDPIVIDRADGSQKVIPLPPTKEYVNPDDARLYDTAHGRATPAPGEMNRKMRKDYRGYRN